LVTRQIEDVRRRVAMAVRRAAATLSVGCIGMRTFTGIDADLEI
jgi:hypothetical protein